MLSAVSIVAGGFAGLLGWIGTVAYLIAYLLLSIKKLRSDTVLYHLLNAIGAAGLIIHAVNLNDYPNLIVNGVWGAIAIFAIALVVRKR